jgi:hypothetical protein
VIPFDPQRGRDRSWGDGASGRESFGARSDWGGRLGEAREQSPTASTWLELPDEPRGAPRRARESRAAWLVAPLILAAIASGLLLVLRGPEGLFGVAFGLVLALGLGWILVSSLLPARAERTCPRCGGEGLERLDPDSSQGLVCRLCSWADESASAFLLLEDEGRPFEDIVLRGRGRSGGPPRA